jgi:hypothetical protein
MTVRNMLQQFKSWVVDVGVRAVKTGVQAFGAALTASQMSSSFAGATIQIRGCVVIGVLAFIWCVGHNLASIDVGGPTAKVIAKATTAVAAVPSALIPQFTTVQTAAVPAASTSDLDDDETELDDSAPTGPSLPDDTPTPAPAATT